MNLSISNIAWLPKEKSKVYRFLNKEKIEGIEIAPKLLLHDIKDIFKLNKKETTRYLKELKKIEKQNDNRRLIYDWIHRNILNHRPFTQTHVEQIKNRNVGSTEIGVPIYKSNITKGGRVYWSSIKKGKTSTIVIYDFCTSNPIL